MFVRGILICFLIMTCGCAPMLSALHDDYSLLKDGGSGPVVELAGKPQKLAVRAAETKPLSPPPADHSLDGTAAPASQVAQIAEPNVIPGPTSEKTAVSLAQRPIPDQDHEIIPAKAKVDDAADKLATLNDDPGEPATLIAARVGDSIITIRELKRAIRERMQGGPGWSQISKAERNQRGREILEYLIDRQILIQAARDELKKPKQWDTLKEMMMRIWTEKELPAMIRRTKSTDEFDLSKKLAERGESLDEYRETFLLEEMARAYLSEKVRNKVQQPDLPEIYRYYRENLDRFQRSAQISWREIFIPTGDNSPESTALAQAETALQRVLSGEDFKLVAKAMSKSPRAQDGGFWQTTPGGFGSESVNAALDKLQVGQVSAVVKDPKGLYIVKLESRRAAGPAPFEDVQTQINEALMNAQFEKAMKVFVEKTQSRIVVVSPLFDGTPYAPKQSRGDGLAYSGKSGS